MKNEEGKKTERERHRGFIKMLHAPAHRSQFNAITAEATKITIKKL